MPNSQSSRLEAFVRAARFRGAKEVRAARVMELIDNALLDVGGEYPEDDRGLLKLAVTAVAFLRQVGEIARGEMDLDFREEAILDAVVGHLGGKVAP